MMPMIATTISSSISVKPFVSRIFMCARLLQGLLDEPVKPSEGMRGSSYLFNSAMALPALALVSFFTQVLVFLPFQACQSTAKIARRTRADSSCQWAVDHLCHFAAPKGGYRRL